MLKKIKIFSILLVLAFTFGSANAAEISYYGIWSDNVYFKSTETKKIHITAWVFTQDENDIVFLKGIPNSSEDYELIHYPSWFDVMKYHTFEDKFFLEDEVEKANWENENYQFYIDENGNGKYDEDLGGGRGEATQCFDVPSGAYKKVGFVQNVTVSGGVNPTITWTPPAEGADIYRVRIFEIDDLNSYDHNLLFSTLNIDDDGRTGNYIFNYSGNLFIEYQKLAIVIEAYDTNLRNKLPYINRSRYYIIHNADSDNDGVIDDWDRCPNTPEGSFVDSSGCIGDCYTPAEVDQIVEETVEQACPGNSENHGRPFTPRN